jgi:hypothetical protein
MSIIRLAAIVLIYLLACAGWMALGITTVVRSGGSGERLAAEVAELWGGPLVQDAPTVVALAADGAEADPALPASSQVEVQLQLDQRRKGLVWYPTYLCRFRATYLLDNPTAAAQVLRFRFALPSADGTYEDFAVAVGGTPSARLVDPRQGIIEEVTVPPGVQVPVLVAYTTRGLSTWCYRPGAHLGRVRNLGLTLHVDTPRIDFPANGLSPTVPAIATPAGVDLVWKTSELITRRDIAVEMPTRLNPGPLTSRITFFAPVCLGFFFLLVGAITVVCRIPIHPMHYLFIAGGFFAFHLLLVYLVDQLDIHLAFAIATATTVALVTGYLRGALGRGFPLSAAIGGQAFFLVLFSYSFFLEGMTGLTVAVGSVATLAVLMRLTLRTDWSQAFGTAPSPPAGGMAETTSSLTP